MYQIAKISVTQASDIIETRTPKGRFWTEDDGVYIGIDNSTGDAWTEEFSDQQSCLAWLNGKLDVGNNNPRVYMVFYETAYYGENNMAYQAFSSLKKARKLYKEWVEDVKSNDHLMQRENAITKEFVDSFEIWKDGYYVDDHCAIWIARVEVQ